MTAAYFPRWAFGALSCVPLVLALSGCGGSGVKEWFDCQKEHPNSSSDEFKACTGELTDRIDRVIDSFMTANGVTAVTVTIIKGSSVLYDRGHGFRDPAGQEPLPANALLLASSIVKPVTAAAIEKLSAAGVLSKGDHAFCNGSNAPCWLSADLLPVSADPRVKDITIQQLLDHQGGWDREVSGDPIAKEAEVQQALGLSTPPMQSDVIRFVLAAPLDFSPGTKTSYSNFGYMLLGRIIEQASGVGYVRYVNEALLSPLGVSPDDFQAVQSLLKDRNPREPNYITTVMLPSVFVPGTMVLAIDGALRAENWLAAGNVISTSKAMATFASHYRLPDGLPLNGQTNNGGHFGEDPGSASILRQLPSGVSYAVLMNKNDPEGTSAYQNQLLTQLDQAVQDAGF